MNSRGLNTEMKLKKKAQPLNAGLRKRHVPNAASYSRIGDTMEALIRANENCCQWDDETSLEAAENGQLEVSKC